eukprot:TRINITY_DN10695_c0_g3_i1.p1 TRINITY_DN10695_c0_g3~~TRINITY_DN10695_c0_g3_i1.p1  ORF type:complete len:418 (+),score=68.63 TRINITY_DN10695_c0_g3_i1:136-1389(+)
MRVYRRHKLRHSAAFVMLAGFLNKASSSSSSSSSSWRGPDPVRSPEDEWRMLPGRCTIDILNESEWGDRFLSEYWFRRPVMLRGYTNGEIETLKRRLQRDVMLRQFGHLEIATGSEFDLTRIGTGRKWVKLRDYVELMESNKTSSGYSFDRGEFFEKSGLSKKWKTIPGLSSALSYAKKSAKEAHLSVVLALGTTGHGIPFHWHMDSYSVALYGRKRWAIYAPGKMTPTGFLASESFVTWLQKRRHDFEGKRFLAPEYECIQEPGDILYVPEGWYHATACIGDSVAVTHVAQRQTWPMNKTAYQYFRRGSEADELKSAIKLLKKGVKRDPSNPAFSAAIAQKYEDIFDWENVEKHARASIQLNPLSLQGHVLLQGALRALQKYDDLTAYKNMADEWGIGEAQRAIDKLDAEFEALEL